MSISGRLYDYFQAISSSRKVHGLSTLSACRSVFRAKLGFGLGPRMHGLFSLAGMPESEWKYFQHHKELEAVLHQVNPGASRSVCGDKSQLSLHCETHGIPHIQTIYHDRPELYLSEAERRESFIRAIEPVTNALFFKLVAGQHGEGAFSSQRSNSGWSYDGESGTTAELYDFCRKRLGADRGWLVQPIVKAHASLQEISSTHALSTARIVTCVTEEGPEIMLALLKLARGSNPVDNFYMGVTGNMVAEIDIASGRLGPAKGSLSKSFPCISSFSVDPDTGRQITGRLVPFWEETKRVVLQAQSTLPGLKSLGWDVAITDQGPCVVETNTNYASELMEVAYGKGLKPVFIDRLKQLV